ncbi:MAG: FMN-binding negative transcriptional regulator [Hyphomicrobiaceae bacterium]
MLYIPPAFKVEDLVVLHQHIAATGLATVITVGDEGPIVSHVPLFLDRDRGPLGTLIGHLARANPQVKRSRLDVQAVAVFQGPDAYISPGWYEAKREHGRVVPTWNYMTVHARGRLTMFEDRERLKEIVDRLTSLHEVRFAKPWTTSDAPPDYIASQLKGIVGIELKIEALEGKHKLGQNRSEADRQGVIEGLSASERPGDAEIAEATQRTLAT